ncbi:histidine phosphatase family protein [Leptospira borgpetersenii]|uniref:Phosphatase n=1 Tax=Leptospira borgpetersenii serovar Hardjo-bovis (strain JB197) TaxID=355277 RepID=Q04QA8_LEPBJ|nr:histidine phosphatase family protein [Leptospira borgpetersenii]ABJ76912.1 Phosphatase [Leptospira borgpetersenii serovar Hardjo-bovis str. JB197]AMX72169.1 phosphatase [Leptospira borgpetersenii serovar Hardjo]TQE54853.1 histidine phosphatase family protein [Leptospira borgpetersenii]
MSAVHLIRHGQANSQGENYDLLTQHGKNQSFALGKFMAQNGECPDRIVTGTLRRHIETAEFFMQGVISVVGDRKKYKCGSFVHRDEGWNEFSTELWRVYSELLSSKRSEFAKTLSQFGKVRVKGGIRSAALFLKLTEEILRFWREGKETPEGIETYESFENRIFHSSNIWFSSGNQERTFIFTSGTPISLVLNRFLRQDEDCFVWMPWIWNTSLSTFRRVRGKYLPVSINGVPHLPDNLNRTLL